MRRRSLTCTKSSSQSSLPWQKRNMNGAGADRHPGIPSPRGRVVHLPPLFLSFTTPWVPHSFAEAGSCFSASAKGWDFIVPRMPFRNRDRLNLKLHQSRQGRPIVARYVSESRLAGMRNKCREQIKENSFRSAERPARSAAEQAKADFHSLSSKHSVQLL